MKACMMMAVLMGAAITFVGGSVTTVLAQSSSTAARSSVRADPQELAAIRRQVLQLVNDTRILNKLAPLSPDPILGREAQKHTDTMVAGGSGPGGGSAFSHEGYAERFAAIRAENPTVTSMGENIGFQDSGARDKAEAMVSLWMRSPSHKKNILGDFTITGLGIGTADDGRLYMTQIFCSGTNSANAKKAMETYTNEGALERDIINMVNSYRVSKKLKPLANDPDLRRLALGHSTDMATGKVKVSHDGFKGRFDSLRKANPLAAAMGENVATNFPGPNAARETVQNWINSPDHRKNMEGAEFSLTGVGVKVSKSGTIYF
ncbi:MAG: CAP domain-containing protein, partial [Candidatus Methylacidiphilales bacterium]